MLMNVREPVYVIVVDLEVVKDFTPAGIRVHIHSELGELARIMLEDVPKRIKRWLSNEPKEGTNG